MYRKHPILAIIDSGIINYNYFKNKISGGISFYIRDNTLYSNNQFNDECGHGTNCAYIICKHCQNVELYIVKIIDATRNCSSILLLEALEHLLHIEVDIINISLSVESDSLKDEIIEVLQRLHNQGKEIFISIKNGKVSSFPANVKCCYGVSGEWLKDNVYYYNIKSGNHIIGNSTPEYSFGVNNEYNWFGSNSKSTALMSASIANSLIQQGNRSVTDIIRKNSIDLVQMSEYSLKLVKRSLELDERKIYEKLIPLFTPYLDRNIIQSIQYKDEIIRDKSFYLIKKSEDILKVKINIDNITYNDFYTLENFSHYIHDNVNVIIE